MVIIQTRNDSNLRGVDDLINGHGDIKDWFNYPLQFKDIVEAESECESLIKGGSYRAYNVRILEVVCTFSSTINVDVKRCKYSQ